MANLSDYIVNFTSLDTLNSVTGRGATTTNDITIGNLTSTGIDDNATSTAITIDASENVGIGTTSPISLGAGYKNLDIRHTTGGGVTLGDTSNVHGYLFSNSDGLTLQAPGTRTLEFMTGSSERMRIDSSGRVGIGMTANSGCLLNVNDHIRAENSAFLAGRETAALPAFAFHDDTDTGMFNVATNILAFSTGGTERMRINSSGNVGIGVVPDSFNTVDGALQVGTRNTITSFSNDIGIGYNHYYNSGWKYANADVASRFSSTSSIPFLWQYAGSGSADGAITWSEAMRIDSSGDVFIKGGGQLKVERSGASNFSSFYTDTGDSTIINNSWSNQKIVLTRDGNVGIGTTSPALASGWSTALHVNGSGSGAHISLTDTTTGATNTDGLVVGQYQANSYFINRENGFQAFYTNNAERMRIDSSGNLLVGTTSASGNVVGVGGEFLTATHNNGLIIGRSGASTQYNSQGLYYTTVYTLNYGSSEIARFDNGGNLNLGDTTWYAAATNRRHLHIKGGTNGAFLALGTSGSGDAYLESDNSGGFNIWNRANGNMLFGTNNAERMRITNAGNLLVGISSTYSTPVVGIGGSLGGGTGVELLNNSGVSWIPMRFHTASNLAGYISSTTTTTAYVTSSDVRLKENIVDAPAGNIDAIRVRSFDWKVDGSHQTYGMVAQELIDVAPEAVSQGQTEDDMWGVDYSKLVPMMIKEIQDLKAEVAALKGE